MTAKRSTQRSTLKRFALGVLLLNLSMLLALALAGCRNPTEPEYGGPCSVAVPGMFSLCWATCPPGTQRWASSTDLVYSTANQCA